MVKVFNSSKLLEAQLQFDGKKVDLRGLCLPDRSATKKGFKWENFAMRRFLGSITPVDEILTF